MVLIGHSFGGFLAGYEGSGNLDLAGMAMISAVNLGSLNADPREREIRLKRWSTPLHPVRGVTASELFAEAARGMGPVGITCAEPAPCAAVRC